MRRIAGIRVPPGALLVSSVVVLVLVLVSVPIEIRGTVDVPGRVLPAQEWTVVRHDDGAVSATLRDHRTGQVATTFLAAPERGDAAQFRLSPGADGTAVAAGDTVGVFASGEAAVRASRLAGDIEAAAADVELYRSGEKTALVEAARQEVERARAAEELAARVATRQRDLLARGVAAERDVEAAESGQRLAVAERAAAEARLDAVQTGSRDAEVRAARARLGALEREAAALDARLRQNALVAPLSGTVYRLASPDTLLMVADASSYTVVLPVRWSDRERVRPGQTVALRTGEWGTPARARVVGLREAPTSQTGQAYLLATAEVVSGADALTPGLLVLCEVEVEPTPLRERAQRLWSDLFR